MHKELIILDDDRQWMEKRIEDLEKEIQALGPEFYDVFNQSSETWHDNAPFDALRDRQSVLFAEFSHLKALRSVNTKPSPKSHKNIVGIGSRVRLDRSGHVREVLIAGHWTHRAGQIVDGAMIVSCESPIAKSIVGNKTGTLTPFGIIETIT